MPRPILLIGGYGVTGGKIARLLRRRHPGLPLLIGGRTQDRADALAAKLGNAHGVRIDPASGSLASFGADVGAVALIVHDPTLKAMAFAAERKVPFLSITGALFELGVDVIPGLALGRRAPVVIAGHWYAGAATMLAIDLASRFAAVDGIHIEITIDQGESGSGSGPGTKADFERISAHAPSVLIRRAGRYLWVPAAEVTASSGSAASEAIVGVGSVSCDVVSIGAATGADDITIMERWIRSPRGTGDDLPRDEISIRMTGRGVDGAVLHVQQLATCARNPASFTAITAAILLERMIGIDGKAGLSAGLYMAEHVMASGDFVAGLLEEGVSIS